MKSFYYSGAFVLLFSSCSAATSSTAGNIVRLSRLLGDEIVLQPTFLMQQDSPYRYSEQTIGKV
jgi:hypothetical protein